MNNLALIGAALSMLALPVPWPISVDQWLRDRTGFTAEQTLARSWRRLVTATQHALQPSRPRSQVHTASIVKRPSTIHKPNDAWFIHRQAVRHHDGSITMRTTQTYYFTI